MDKRQALFELAEFMWRFEVISGDELIWLCSDDLKEMAGLLIETREVEKNSEPRVA